VVLVVEDAHWADCSSRELLDFLAHRGTADRDSLRRHLGELLGLTSRW